MSKHRLKAREELVVSIVKTGENLMAEPIVDCKILHIRNGKVTEFSAHGVMDTEKLVAFVMNGVDLAQLK